MKKAKKKSTRPRQKWVINPVTRVKPSGKIYSRPRAKKRLSGLDE